MWSMARSGPFVTTRDQQVHPWMSRWCTKRSVARRGVRFRLDQERGGVDIPDHLFLVFPGPNEAITASCEKSKAHVRARVLIFCRDIPLLFVPTSSIISSTLCCIGIGEEERNCSLNTTVSRLGGRGEM